MPEPTLPEPTIWKIPTPLDGPAARARIASRADALRSGEFLQARFFADGREVHRLTLSEGDEVPQELPHAATSTATGALHIRVARQELAPPPDPVDFAMHADTALLARFVHHLFAIPIGRGFTAAFAAREFPGYTWQGIQLVLQAAELIVARGARPPELMPTVAALHFTDATCWLVEWADGSRTWPGGATA